MVHGDSSLGNKKSLISGNVLGELFQHSFKCKSLSQLGPRMIQQHTGGLTEQQHPLKDLH